MMRHTFQCARQNKGGKATEIYKALRTAPRLQNSRSGQMGPGSFPEPKKTVTGELPRFCSDIQLLEGVRFCFSQRDGDGVKNQRNVGIDRVIESFRWVSDRRICPHTEQKMVRGFPYPKMSA